MCTYSILDLLKQNVSIEVTVQSRLKQMFIAAFSENPINRIIYEDGIDHLNYIYDHEAFITQQDTHSINIKSATKLYMYVGYINQDLNSDNNFTIAIYNHTGNCIRRCSSCFNGKCMCVNQTFGEYCQLDRSNILLDSQYDSIIKPFAWKFQQFQIEQLGSSTLRLRIQDQSADIFMGLAIDGLIHHDIPNLHYDVYQIPKNRSTQSFYLQTHLQDFIDQCQQCKVLTIGFYNPNTYPIIFYFELLTQDEIKVEESYRVMKIINISFIVIVVGLLLFALMFYQKRRRQQQILIQNRFYRRGRRTQTIQQLNGFKPQFIDLYFPGFYFFDLVAKYPQLKEHQECVVCLERFEPTSEQAEQVINQCSVTPCFHIFHQHCLHKWLLTQKCCPLCRKQFEDQQVRKKQWVHLDDDESSRETQRVNPYILRMKTRSENTQASEFPIQMDDHREEEMQRQQPILPMKSARDLVKSRQ